MSKNSKIVFLFYANASSNEFILRLHNKYLPQKIAFFFFNVYEKYPPLNCTTTVRV